MHSKSQKSSNLDQFSSICEKRQNWKDSTTLLHVTVKGVNFPPKSRSADRNPKAGFVLNKLVVLKIWTVNWSIQSIFFHLGNFKLKILFTLIWLNLGLCNYNLVIVNLWTVLTKFVIVDCGILSVHSDVTGRIARRKAAIPLGSTAHSRWTHACLPRWCWCLFRVPNYSMGFLCLVINV